MNPNFNIFLVRNNLQKASLQKVRVFNLGESMGFYFLFLLIIIF
jgi:hypothetical protein